MRRLAILVAALSWWLIAAPQRARGAATTDIYTQTAAREGVPLALLVAIAGAESGYHPWALNIDGHEFYCRSRAEAETALARGGKVAIGLMQINWDFWGPRLGVSKTQLLDPATNLKFGARILKQDLHRHGSVWRRISNYHAGSLKRRDEYNRLVYDRYVRYLRGELDH